jgi:hypothetical protein
VNFTVVWSPEAEQQLASVWLAAADRNAVTHAANAIDVALAANPHGIGVLVFDTVREYTCTPLGVEFEIIDADCRVIVLTVWDTTRGRPILNGN